MDPLSSARQAVGSQSQSGAVVVPTGASSVMPAALPSGGAQLAFFPPPTAFGMPPPFLGTSATGEIKIVSLRLMF